MYSTVPDYAANLILICRLQRSAARFARASAYTLYVYHAQQYGTIIVRVLIGERNHRRTRNTVYMYSCIHISNQAEIYCTSICRVLGRATV